MAGPMGSPFGARFEHSAGAGVAGGGAGGVGGREDTVSSGNVAVTRFGIRAAGDIVVGVGRCHLVTVQRFDPPPRSRLVMGNGHVTLGMRGRRDVDGTSRLVSSDPRTVERVDPECRDSLRVHSPTDHPLQFLSLNTALIGPKVRPLLADRATAIAPWGTVKLKGG